MEEQLYRFSLEELVEELEHMRSAATSYNRAYMLFKVWQEEDPELAGEFTYEMELIEKLKPVLTKYMHTLEQEIERKGKKPAYWRFRPKWAYTKEKIMPEEVVELRDLAQKLILVEDIDKFLIKRRK